MLLLIFNLIFVNPPVDNNSLDSIYNNFHNHQHANKTQVNVIVDKDFYFPGERVFYTAKMTNSNGTYSILNNWAYVFLFDEKGKILDHHRVLLNDGLARSSLLISDSINTSKVYMSIVTGYTKPTFSKALYLITDNQGHKDSMIVNEKIEIKSKNKYLIPGKVNQLWISNSRADRINAQIINKNGDVERELRLEHGKVINFVPYEGQRYYLKTQNGQFEFPEVKKGIDLDINVYEHKLKINIDDFGTNKEDNTLMVTAGDEILWLSQTAGIHSTIEIPIGKFKSSYIFCFLLNSDKSVIDYEIVDNNLKHERIGLKEIGDTLIFDIPERFNGLPFLTKIVDSNYQINRLTFNDNEIKELAKYGTVPHHMYFKNNSEKLNWLNYSFDFKSQSLTKSSEIVSNQESIGSLIYSLPDDTRINEHLSVNVIDAKGRIIDYRLNGHDIVIDINEFDTEENFVLLTATYKKNKLRLTKDTISVLDNLEKYARAHLEKIKRYQTKTNGLAFEYLDVLKRLENITILDDVTIKGQKFRIHYQGKGRTKTYQQLVLDEFTFTALDILPQIGVLGRPSDVSDWNPGVSAGGNGLSINEDIGDIKSRGRYRNVNFATKSMSLTIYGTSNRIYYQGRDFSRLKQYPAEWVYAITKRDSQPEGVNVFLKPGFRGEENYVYTENIFSQPSQNDNAGILHWDYHKLENEDNIKIPLSDEVNAVNWTLSFSHTDGTTTEFEGIYESSMND